MRNRKITALVLALALLLTGLYGCRVQPEIQSQNSIPLQFEKVNADIAIAPIDQGSVKAILKELKLSNSRIFAFQDHDDNEALHLGMEIEKAYYDLGQISMYTEEQPLTLVNMQYSYIAGKESVKATGIMGANYAHTLYAAIESNKPVILLSCPGDPIETDLDKDGKAELIATYGTAAQTDIYQLREGAFYKADVNRALEAEAVYMTNEDRLEFEAYIPRIKSLKHFKFTKDGMLPLD